MAGEKASQIWLVNIISFILFSILTITGLINWLLPHGNRGGGGGALISLRHFLVGIHEWAGLFFIAVICFHLALHWAYVKTNLKRHGILK
jgi:hypothetical protein